MQIDYVCKSYRVVSYIKSGESEKAGLTLQQIQLALVAIDPTTCHGGLCAQYRCQLIFNYYTDMASKMTWTQFKYILENLFYNNNPCFLFCRAMCVDIFKLKGVSYSTNEELEDNVKQQWR